MPSSSDVQHDPAHDRFELSTDDGDAVVVYQREGDVLSLVHTEVPSASEGKGVGSALVSGALDLVRENGWTVRPVCPFVAAYIERHPAYADLVAA